jgi:hypothetical protein
MGGACGANDGEERVLIIVRKARGNETTGKTKAEVCG